MHARSLAAFAACITLVLAGCASMEDRSPAGPLKVVSESTLTGFVFPESVGCDADERVLYVGNFGGKELKPAEKDGLGYVSKVSLDGKVIEQRAFDVTMNKPKGIWIERGRLWVTDIDGVWIFDTRSKKGRKLMLPGIQFANDPAVAGGALYVTDNRSDQVYRVEPADFLDAALQPEITSLASKKDVNPNGIWPARDGSLLLVGFLAADKPRGIYAMSDTGLLRPIRAPSGRLDGVHEMRDGSLLVTDWNTGALFQWSEKGGVITLAKDFKGPADFCVMGDTVYVPDLVKSEVRVVKLSR
jgi:sugar lactone lactonase YvrE